MKNVRQIEIVIDGEKRTMIAQRAGYITENTTDFYVLDVNSKQPVSSHKFKQPLLPLLRRVTSIITNGHRYVPIKN